MGYYRRGDVVFINIPFRIGSNEVDKMRRDFRRLRESLKEAKE